MPSSEANISADCSRWVEVRLDDAVKVFVDHAHWQYRSENRVLSIERFASKMCKRGEIVTIGSPKAFLMLQIFLWG